MQDEVPKVGDKIEYQGFQLEITQMEMNRILKLPAKGSKINRICLFPKNSKPNQSFNEKKGSPQCPMF